MGLVFSKQHEKHDYFALFLIDLIPNQLQNYKYFLTYANITSKFYKILLFEGEEERTRGLEDERMRGKGR